ncbi:MAG TPA: universal stress protein [Desulfocapsa sulfexigens]|nr:universal stress protein [Desulfocapsa sulfexigens]
MSAGMGDDLAGHFGHDKLDSFYKEGLAESKKAMVGRVHVVLAEAGDELGNFSVELKVEVRVMHPVKQIVEMVMDGGYDLVVPRTHGHSMLDDIYLGSVARASCSGF